MNETSIGSLKVYLILLFLLLFPINPQTAFADRGLITSPQTSLEESGQTAIVAWNEREEVLILSTDVRSSRSALVLEILPIPSKPTKVEEGSFDSFRKISELINKRLKTEYFYRSAGPADGEGVEVVFHKEIGAHDVTVVRVNDLDHFTEWVSGFARGKGVELSVSSGFRDAVSDYLGRGIRYFVFDVVETSETTKSVNPLIYRFETDRLYYPLRITAASDISGQTYSSVNLFLISKGRINSTVISDISFSPRSGFNRFIELSGQELHEISPELADLFEGDPLVMNAYYYGPLTSLKEDLIVKNEDIHTPTLLERLSQRILEKPISSLLYSGLRSYHHPWQTIFGKFVTVTWLLSFLFGIPASIFLMARIIGDLAKRSPLRPLTKRLLNYGLAITVITFLLFSDIMEVVTLSVVCITPAGFAALIFMILKLIRRLS